MAHSGRVMGSRSPTRIGSTTKLMALAADTNSTREMLQSSSHLLLFEIHGMSPIAIDILINVMAKVAHVLAVVETLLVISKM